MVSTSTLRLTSDDMDVPLLLVGRDHRVSFANAAAHQLLAYEGGGLHGLPLTRLVPSGRHGELQNIDAVLAGQAPRRVRSAVTRSDGTVVDVHVGFEACVDDAGAVVAVSLRYEPVARASLGPRGQESMQAPRADVPESGFRLDAVRVARIVADQLHQVQALLEQLDEKLTAAQHTPRKLEHARGILTEARELIEECELDLDALAPTTDHIPKAPKLPRE